MKTFLGLGYSLKNVVNGDSIYYPLSTLIYNSQPKPMPGGVGYFKVNRLLLYKQGLIPSI